MSYRNIRNNDDNDDQMVIGDILLHSETKIIPIQVILQSITTKSTEENGKINIPRREITTNDIKISCDVKNSTPEKIKHGKSLSTKKIIKIHKAGWILIKELKSKVITINPSDSNRSDDSIYEQTKF